MIDVIIPSHEKDIDTLDFCVNYAKENEMILVTRDTESGQACEENGLPCILLDNNEIFKIVTEKLKNF